MVAFSKYNNASFISIDSTTNTNENQTLDFIKNEPEKWSLHKFLKRKKYFME